MPFDGSLAAAILYHLNVIVSTLKDDEAIPLNFLTDIFSGGVLNHNEVFLIDEQVPDRLIP